MVTRAVDRPIGLMLSFPADFRHEPSNGVMTLCKRRHKASAKTDVTAPVSISACLLMPSIFTGMRFRGGVSTHGAVAVHPPRTALIGFPGALESAVARSAAAVTGWWAERQNDGAVQWADLHRVVGFLGHPGRENGADMPARNENSRRTLALLQKDHDGGGDKI